MKKNAKKEIRKAWAISIISYFIAGLIYLVAAVWAVETFNIYWGFILLAPLAGFIIASPLLIREENIIQHFERVLKKEKDL